jgi:hypothetical protein
VLANDVIGVGGKFVVTLLVMRTYFPYPSELVDADTSRGLTAEPRIKV